MTLATTRTHDLRVIIITTLGWIHLFKWHIFEVIVRSLVDVGVVVTVITTLGWICLPKWYVFEVSALSLVDVGVVVTVIAALGWICLHKCQWHIFDVSVQSLAAVVKETIRLRVTHVHIIIFL